MQFIKELIEAGLTERQAEVIARHQAGIITGHPATKQDLELLKKELIIKLGAIRRYPVGHAGDIEIT